MATGPGLTAALKHRDYRLMISAFTLSDIGTWAYSVALTVWIYDATGSVGWIAAATVCRFVPALVFSAYAGVIADRLEKIRLMTRTDLVFAAIMVVMALLMTIDGPVVAVLAVAALSSTLGTVYVPAAAAMTPQVVPEAELASANALRNTIENVTVIAGPGLGALLLLAGPPQNAVWINAATFAASALIVSRVRARSTPVDVTEGGEAGPLAQMLVGVKAISASPATAILVGFSVLATMGFGIDTVLFVSASDRILGTGPDGYGYLLAGLGLGGILAAPLVTRAESRPSLGPIIVAGMATYALPTLVLLATSSPMVAFVSEVVRGAGTLFVDVLAITAMQRTLSGDILARVFGAFNALMLGAVLAGSTLASILIGTAGVDTTIWLAGAGLFALSLVGLPWLRQMDAASRARREELAPRIAVIEACRLFEEVPDGGLTQLAAASTEVSVGAGDVVIRQGEPADDLYLVLAGRMSVSSTGADGVPVTLPAMDFGILFGEIGLIERIPRTATVTAQTDARLLRIDGATFLETLTAGTPSAAIIDGASLRLGRTHPLQAVRRAGLAGAEEGTAA